MLVLQSFEQVGLSTREVPIKTGAAAINFGVTVIRTSRVIYWGRKQEQLQ